MWNEWIKKLHPNSETLKHFLYLNFWNDFIEMAYKNTKIFITSQPNLEQIN